MKSRLKSVDYLAHRQLTRWGVKAGTMEWDYGRAMFWKGYELAKARQRRAAFAKGGSK